LEIVLPEPIARKLRKRAEELKMDVNDLIIQALVKVIEGK